MDISLAPAQTMRTSATQKRGIVNSCRILRPSPFSVSISIGQERKLKVLYSGISAQMQARMRQLSIPKTAKNKVDNKITPTEPQQ